MVDKVDIFFVFNWWQSYKTIFVFLFNTGEGKEKRGKMKDFDRL
jgi:hypothetical protein